MEVGIERSMGMGVGRGCDREEREGKEERDGSLDCVDWI